MKRLIFSLLSDASSGSTKLIEATEWLQLKLDRCCAGKLTIYANIISVYQIFLQSSLERWRLCVCMDWNCLWKYFTTFVDPDWKFPFFFLFSWHIIINSVMLINFQSDAIHSVLKKKSIENPPFFFQKLQTERSICTYSRGFLRTTHSRYY